MVKPAFKVITAISLVFLSACAAGGISFKKIELGMSKDQVVALMGKPDGYRTQDGKESYIYFNRYIDPVVDESTADYLVIFKDEQVVEYQPMNARN